MGGQVAKSKIIRQDDHDVGWPLLRGFTTGAEQEEGEPLHLLKILVSLQELSELSIDAGEIKKKGKILGSITLLKLFKL